MEKGYDVHILADGVSSRAQVDRMFALEVSVCSLVSTLYPQGLIVCLLVQRLRGSGAFISTSEAVLFELMGDSKHPKFKEIQSLVKTSAPDSGLLTKL